MIAALVSGIVIVTNAAFVAAFDTDSRCPAWVEYDLAPSEIVVTNRAAILTLVGGIGTAVLIALLCLFGDGCIRIANVESFVTVPKDAVSFGVSNER